MTAVPYVEAPTVYLAARFSRRRELRGYRDGDLARLGIRVTSRWLDGHHQIDDEGRPVSDTGRLLYPGQPGNAAFWRQQFAADDYIDTMKAQALIAFTEVPRSTNSRGGRHVELGIALGAGKPIYIVGPRENVFCYLDHVRQFDTWADLVTHLERRAPAEVVL